MTPKTHRGRLLLTRVPRTAYVSLLVALLMFLAHMFGFAKVVGDVDLAHHINTAIDALVVLAAAAGVGALKKDLDDPKRYVDVEVIREVSRDVVKGG